MIGTHPTRLALILTLSGSVAMAQPPAEPLSLWYRQPAEQWVEALAVGNGRLGAMVFGRVAQERIQLNEDTLWAGGPYDPANPNWLLPAYDTGDHPHLNVAGYQEMAKAIDLDLVK